MLAKEEVVRLLDVETKGSYEDWQTKEQVEYETSAQSELTDENDITVEGVEFKHIEREGGCEGGGEHCHIVFSTTKDGVTQLFKVNGFYASHHGSDWYWDQLEEVEPVQVTVTRYEAKKK